MTNTVTKDSQIHKLQTVSQIHSTIYDSAKYQNNNYFVITNSQSRLSVPECIHIYTCILYIFLFNILVSINSEHKFTNTMMQFCLFPRRYPDYIYICVNEIVLINISYIKQHKFKTLSFKVCQGK